MKLVWIIVLIIIISAVWFLFASKSSIQTPVSQDSKQTQNQEKNAPQQDNSGKIANQRTQTTKNTNNMQNLQIKSTAFVNNGKIPAKYTCDGEGVNPELLISAVPENAKSLVLIVDDPDAPGGTFNHWVIWNIPPTVSTIKEGASIEGIAGINSGGDNGYFGPCPPSGTHRYVFKLYALDTLISLDNNDGSSDVKSAISSHIIGQTQLIGLYR
jgi:Raf kinase inhibitor-like YbhB/YbcL family protein